VILDSFSFSFFPALSSLISSKFSVEFLCILLKYYQGYPKGEFIFYFYLFFALQCFIFWIVKYSQVWKMAFHELWWSFGKILGHHF
jgi:hypothetical protein